MKLHLILTYDHHYSIAVICMINVILLRCSFETYEFLKSYVRLMSQRMDGEKYDLSHRELILLQNPEVGET